MANEGNCCAMKGYLSFLILSLIDRTPCSGEDLSKEIEKRKGEKPSPGTIYPVLKHLKESGFLNEMKQGKSIIYSLSSEGKSALTEAKKEFRKTFKDIV